MPLEMLERFILDPISEGGSDPLEVTGRMTPDPEGHGFGLLDISFPRPEVQRQWSGSRGTEGERPAGDPRYMNRKIPVKVWGFEGIGIGPALNLITNPSFEKDSAGWFGSTNGLVVAGAGATRNLTGYSGEYAWRLAASAVDQGVWTSVTLASATVYTLRFAARKISGAMTALKVARATTNLATLSLSNEWQMFEVSIPATTAGAHAVSFRVDAAGTFEIDAVCLMSSAVTAPYYFDGDTPGCSWTGTPHASTSERRGSGSDLKRFLDCIHDLESKLEKLAKVGGTAKRYLPDGTPVAFDILDAIYPGDWQRTISQGRMEFSFELTAKPFGRLPPIVLATINKAAATSLQHVDTGVVPGNAPALVRMKVTDIGAAQRNWLLTGASQRTDPYQLLAKTRQLLGGSLANSPTSAATTNGGSTNGVVTMALNAAWRPILSTNDSGPVYQTHEGPQRVLARVFLPATNAAQVDLKFEWAQADLARWSTSDMLDGSRYVSIPADQQVGSWRWVDFGVINPTKPRSDIWRDAAGWRWEGRLTARSSGGNIQVDAFAVVPADEFLAECFANPQIPEPNDAVIGSGFAAGSGNLAGSAADVGGNWSEIGGGTSFQRLGLTPQFVKRTLTGPDAAPKFARLGATTAAGILGQVEMPAIPDWPTDPTFEKRGLLLRYVDANNYIFAGQTFAVFSGNIVRALFLRVMKAGVLLYGPTASMPSNWGGRSVLSVAVTTTGAALAALVDGNGSSAATVQIPANADMATGGVLASGGFGLAHEFTNATAGRAAGWFAPTFRSLTASVVDDAIIFPSQSAILTHDNALRFDAGGSSLGEVGRYQGDRLLVPAGASSRIVVMDSRVAPGVVDSNLDRFSIDLSLIPRVVGVPEPV